MKKLLSCFLSFCLLMPFSACKQKESEHSATQIMMDTVVTISVYAESSDILTGAFELCKHYEQLFSRTIDTSDISRINNSNEKAVNVDPETLHLLKTALEINEKSNGAFDFTITPLVELWNVNKATDPPTDDQISTLLPFVNSRFVELKDNSVTVTNGCKIDLGGIAKGYIADKIKEYLTKNGVTRGTINLGGNVMLIGDNNGAQYNVGIQKPFAKAGETALTIKLSNKTAVTSGIYERYFEHDGNIYHHIIDPKTGYPVENNIASVTIIAESSIIADGLSTACLVLGVDEGKHLAELYGAQTIFIMKDGTIIVSDGLSVDQNGELPCVKMK